MEIVGNSIFKRKSRLKKIRLKDGSFKDTKISGGWFYRIRYIDNDGSNKTKERGPLDFKKNAEEQRDVAIDELNQSSGQIVNGEKMTFADLAEICERDIYQDKSASNRYIIKTLRRFFGDRRIGAIDRGAIDAYIHRRTSESIRTTEREDLKRNVQRSTVDRELRIMRSMIYHAIDEGWIIKNPFRPSKKLKSLINTPVGDRERTLTPEEEWRLLAFCEHRMRDIVHRRKATSDKAATEWTKERMTSNEWLKPIVLCGLDGGMRRGEILTLEWNDIDLATLMVDIRAQNVKTKKGRRVGISNRLALELQNLRKSSTDKRVFPITWITRAFNTACRLADIKDFTFRDLRRTFDSRQQAAGGDLLATAEVAGHSPEIALKHYVKTGDLSARNVRDRVNEINQRNAEMFELNAEKELIN